MTIMIRSFKKPSIVLLFVGIGLIHLLVSFLTIIPSHFSIDEIIYHLMVKNFAESGSLGIWNGYEEFPSRELVPRFTRPFNGRLAPKYPYLFPVLATPFYWLGGYFGIFFINVLAFLGIIALCYATAQKLFQDSRLARNACFILAFATFSWEYSQAVWPHTLTTLFVVTAFYLCVCALLATTSRTAQLLSLLSGIVAGFGLGIRFDVIFVFPCIVLPFLFAKPWRPKCLWSTISGMMPGLLTLCVTNYLKFGTFTPLSYGGNENFNLLFYLPVIGLGGIGLLLAWGFTRFPVMILFWRHYKWWFLLGVGMTVLLMLIIMAPILGNRLNRIVHVLVDLRVRWDRSLKDIILGQTDWDPRVTQLGALKKALLQSCPYLIGLIIPLLRIIRGDREARSLLLSVLVPLAFVGYYSYSGWSGSLCWNLRYLVPIFPLTSILMAYTWRELNRNLHWRWRQMAFGLSVLSLLTIAAYFFVSRPLFTTLEQQAFPYLTFPLILVGTLTVLIGIHEMVHVSQDISSAHHKFWQKTISLGTIVVLFIAMVWSGLVAFFYDYPLARRNRKYGIDLVVRSRFVIRAENAIFFVTFPDRFYGIIEYGQIRMANPKNDDFHDFLEITQFHLQQGNAVYAALLPLEWLTLRKQGFWASFELQSCLFYIHRRILCEIKATSEEEAPQKNTH